MTTVIIPLRRATDYERESYGITYRSEFVYSMTGPGLHNPHSPHRITVWDNTVRPNTEPWKYNQYSGKPGAGRYLSPDRKGTDLTTSVLTSAESTTIASHGSNTGTPASGQVYAAKALAIAGFAVLQYPDGALSDPFVVASRSLNDPELIPVWEYER